VAALATEAGRARSPDPDYAWLVSDIAAIDWCAGQTQGALTSSRGAKRG